MGITWSPAATDDFLSILKKVEELFGKMIAIKVSNKIQLHIGLLSSFPQIGVRDAIFSTADRDVRYLINTPNLIYYAIEQEEIYIKLYVKESLNCYVNINSLFLYTKNLFFS